jgi:serine/threonine-protein kinase RsbW
MGTRLRHSDASAADVRFSLDFAREALSIPVMRHVLGDTLIRLGVDEACVADLLLAVTEACTNVLRHAGTGRRYEIVTRLGRDRCQVDVLDSGRGFDPARLCDTAGAAARRPPGRPSVRSAARIRRRQCPPGLPPGSPPVPLLGRFSWARRMASQRAVANLPESGRGLAIMRACVDDVELRTGPGKGTVVSLRKQIEWRSDAPLARLPARQLRDAG